jgi:acyl-CoA thioester hydrolase
LAALAGSALSRWLAKLRLMSPSRPQPQARSAYRVFRTLGTRWMDNDIYGHVNNVVYYSWFDTAVNSYLIEQDALDIHAGEVIGLVIETQCNYFEPLAFPQTIHAGLRVTRLGQSSVRYEVGLFAEDGSTSAAAGHFIHVYVDRHTRRPVPLPDALRTALTPLIIEATA